MERIRIPEFDPVLFLECADQFQSDELILNSTPDRLGRLKAEDSETGEIIPRQYAGNDMNLLWKKMRSTLSLFRRFIAPEESSSFPALEKAAVIHAHLDTTFFSLIERWRRLLASSQVQLQDGGDFESSSVDSNRIFLQIFLYGLGLHPESSGSEDPSFPEFSDKNFSRILTILRFASGIISETAVQVDQCRQEF